MADNELETWLSEEDLSDLNDRQPIQGYVKLGTALEYLTKHDNRMRNEITSAVEEGQVIPAESLR